MNRKSIDPEANQFTENEKDSFDSSDSAALTLPEFQQTSFEMRPVRSLWQVERRAGIEMATEAARAELAHTAVANVGALSALADQLATLAPASAARNKAIIDSYALKSVERVFHFGGR